MSLSKGIAEGATSSSIYFHSFTFISASEVAFMFLNGRLEEMVGPVQNTRGRFGSSRTAARSELMAGRAARVKLLCRAGVGVIPVRESTECWS